jgi:ribonuclease VapC
MRTRTYLLDSSALLAAIFNETGADTVIPLLDDCSIHAVNLSETFRRILQTGIAPSQAQETLEALELDVIALFSSREAFAAGRLGSGARKLGLSLGDTVCLSVAAQTGQTILTADRRWSEIGELVKADATLAPAALKIQQIR